MPDTAMNPRQTVDEIIGRPIEFYQGIKGKEREAKAVSYTHLTLPTNSGV